MTASDIKQSKGNIIMRVFVTGATGFVGSAVVRELIDAGHQVLGLARTDAAAATLVAAGASAHRGSLEDIESLRIGASGADAAIHTAFIHDFANIPAAAATDERAIAALGEAFAHSDRPLIVTSGTAIVAPGRIAGEDNTPDPALAANWPRKSEEAASAAVDRGASAAIVRLPPSVHGNGDHGFVPMLISIARAKGVSAYVGDGSNRWPAVHRFDAARLYRLAIERPAKGARYHAIDDEGVAFREIAETISRHLDIPARSVSSDAAAEHFGFLGLFAAMDVPASSEWTRQQLGWNPTQPGLLVDLNAGHYFENATVAHHA
jgi:nucleoside-diphosphate-sugar epimerase